jgi:hypothetical protein
MAHPFEKIFESALKKSTPEENEVLVEAEKILKKGYSHAEIYAVLVKLKQSLVLDADERIVGEAVEEFGRHFDV